MLRSPDALRRLLWQPGELGLAEAYIVGDLDIEGDLADGLGRAWQSVREHGTATPGPTGWARARRSPWGWASPAYRRTPRTPPGPPQRQAAQFHP